MSFLVELNVYTITERAEKIWRSEVFAFIPGFSPWENNQKIWG